MAKAKRVPAAPGKSPRVRVDFTVLARPRRGGVELVRVPKKRQVATEGEVRVIASYKVPKSRLEPRSGRTKAKPPPTGIIGDASGQAALKAFRAAVREAKRQ